MTLRGRLATPETLRRRLALGLTCALAASVVGHVAHAQDDEQVEDEVDTSPYARIIVDSAALRSGPGAGYRQVGLALRGDVLPVRGRATRGFWFEVERPDGTHAFVLGSAVYVHEVSDDEASGGRLWPRLFAPPPLPEAHGEIAITFGMLGDGGFMALRPAIYLAPEAGIELTAAASVSKAGRLLIGGLGGILNVFPRSPVVPYVVVGGGVAQSTPNADTFLLESGMSAMLYGGGGLRFGFRHRLIVRIEARAYAFFEANRYVAKEEYSGGLTVFF
ncbi:MAG: SH3 domain-containing protein [Deltaproteobacteria bacterium]|nr:SH3 domain-containing protein [Deltaproteobacteria bacterium]